MLELGLFDRLIGQARQSARLRVNHNFHASMEENPHRFLNVMLRGTYITPHRHIDPPKPEAFLVLRGEVAFFTFTDSGQVNEIHKLGRDPIGIDVEPGLWHTLAVLSPDAVCYEVKPGPYSPLTDKEFASWAPRESDPGASKYLEALISLV